MTTIRWGILGTGAIAGQFAEGLSFVKGARLQAVASRELARARAFAGQHGATTAHPGYHQLVTDPAVDVVYVATPNHLHQEHCLQAIEAGKAVLCEKPFALDLAQARTVVEAARRRRVFCMEAMWMRFSPALREALSRVQRGELGEPRLLIAQLGFSHRPDPRSRLFAPPGGGALLDLGVYCLSLAHALFGRPTTLLSQPVIGATGVDEQVAMVLGYSGGRQALLAASVRSQLANSASIHGAEGLLHLGEPVYFPLRYRLVAAPAAVLGEAGGAIAPRPRLARLRLHPWARRLAEARRQLRNREVVRRPPGNGYGCEAEEVGRCLRAGLLESPLLPLEATLDVLETMDALRRQWPAPR